MCHFTHVSVGLRGWKCCSCPCCRHQGSCKVHLQQHAQRPGHMHWLCCRQTWVPGCAYVRFIHSMHKLPHFCKVVAPLKEECCNAAQPCGHDQMVQQSCCWFLGSQEQTTHRRTYHVGRHRHTDTDTSSKTCSQLQLRIVMNHRVNTARYACRVAHCRCMMQLWRICELWKVTCTAHHGS